MRYSPARKWNIWEWYVICMKGGVIWNNLSNRVSSDFSESDPDLFKGAFYYTGFTKFKILWIILY